MFPARAGVIPGSDGASGFSVDVPRASGGDPGMHRRTLWAIVCSPRERG